MVKADAADHTRGGFLDHAPLAVSAQFPLTQHVAGILEGELDIAGRFEQCHLLPFHHFRIPHDFHQCLGVLQVRQTQNETRGFDGQGRGHDAISAMLHSTVQMRAYYIPASAGVLLIVSAFLPWMHVGEVRLGGVPETAGLWILGLGAVAVLLAGLSMWTRKNSRHPLLLVGLAAFAIMFLGYQWMSRTVRDASWAQAQANSIVNDVPVGAAPATAVGLGIYLGLVAATTLVLFGLTIVVKRVPSAYAVSQDDDV